MAPQIPGTNVFLLESTLGLSFPHNSGLSLSEPGGVQSCFAVSGTTAEDRSLHWRGRAGAVYGGQGAVFIHSGLDDFALPGTGAPVVSAAGGSLGHVDACATSHHAPPSHGYEIECTPQSDVLDASEDR